MTSIKKELSSRELSKSLITPSVQRFLIGNKTTYTEAKDASTAIKLLLEKGVTLKGLYLSNRLITDIDFRNQDLTGLVLRNCKVLGCDFSEAILRDSSFKGSTLNRTWFVNADLTNVDLTDTTMTNVDLDSAVLAGAKVPRYPMKWEQVYLRHTGLNRLN